MIEIETNTAVETREVQTEFWIPARNLTKLTQKLDRLVRRANKLGVEPIRYEVTNQTEEREVGALYAAAIAHVYGYDVDEVQTSAVTSPLVYETYTLVRVEGVAPKFAGWSLVARATFDLGKAVFLTVPEQSVPDNLRNVGPVCHHCKSARIRKDTFIVKSDAGEYLSVGSNCLADFLGHQSPETIAWQAGILWTVDGLLDGSEEFSEDWIAGFRKNSTYDLANFLANVVTYTRLNGWITAGAAEKLQKTPSQVELRILLNPHTKTEREALRKFKAEQTEADIQQAAAAIEWAKTQDGNSEYAVTIRTIAESGRYSDRLAGLAASIVGSHKRHIEGEVVRKAKLASIPSVHQGVVGEKLSRKLLLVASRSFDSAFGVTNLNRFSDEDGNVYIWWTSTELDVEVGEWCNLSGTVKAHDAYRDVPQTVLTRCKLVPTADEQAEIAGLSAEAAALVVDARSRSDKYITKPDYSHYSDEDAEVPPLSELLNKGWVAFDQQYVWSRPAHVLAAVKLPKAKRAKKTA